MAELPSPELIFDQDGCPDCGQRFIDLPPALPDVGDDFDWSVRDYDGFRIMMLEELAARFPERKRWTPGDIEVVIVEALAAVLDQLSDMLDRVASEAYLETARQPETVQRLLNIIGYDAVAMASDRANLPQADAPADEAVENRYKRLLLFHPALRNYGSEFQSIAQAHLSPQQQAHLDGFIAKPEQIKKDEDTLVDALDAVQFFLDKAPLFVTRARHDAFLEYWSQYPHAMEAAKTAGPRSIHTQKRLVALTDFDTLFARHPLVYRAHAWRDWGGSWPVIRVALSLWDNRPLDNTADDVVAYPLELQNRINRFHRQQGLREIDWTRTPNPSIRTVLRILMDQYRMVGQEVVLEGAVFVGIVMSLSISVKAHYFQSEVRQAVEYALGRGPEGFFRPGRLDFGENLYASDIFETLMKLEGVENVCLNRFKRIGRHFPDQTAKGFIVLSGLEVAVCDNRPAAPERGYYHLKLHGGRRG